MSTNRVGTNKKSPEHSELQYFEAKLFTKERLRAL